MDRTVLFNLQRMGMEKHADLFRENRIKWETLREMSRLTMSSLFAGKVNELFEFERAYKKLNGNWAIPETELPPSGSQVSPTVLEVPCLNYFDIKLLLFPRN
ncbi:uncharacterized protein LOC117653815 [Thrips palmi]|uniref:Uncharacterized protein LOC117653815 n=1 Tax=Thrips palmi TaxID=161013 RepID=A0A6P9ABX0_THRPL|nr:uncharacterized protein LOC117653815 [Thrips palmi]